LSDALGALAAAPSAEVLLNRLWKRMPREQRQLLGALAVFDGPAPRDAWTDYASDIDALQQRELLVADDRGGVSVPEAARAFALQRLPAETLAELHLDAAQVREVRGEFTAAARHYLEAGQPALAVWVWFNNRDLETERGHAPAARVMFRKLRADDLPDADDRRALTLLRAEQFLLTGAADDAAAELDLTRWPRAHPASPLAQELRGDAQQQQGRVEQALAQYRDALQLLGDAQHRQIERLHTKAGYVYLYRVRDLALAQHEADMALSQAHNFRGLVAEEAGRYDEALAQYAAALRLAESMPRGEAARAVTHSHLGHLHMRRGDSAAAIHHLEIAIAHAQRIGQPVNALYDQLNMASALIVAGRHAEALAQAQAALTLAEPMGNAFLVAGLTAAASEACLGANELDAAERYALHSLREEEELHRAYALTALGHVQQQRGRGVEAARSFEAAVASAQAVHDKYAEAHAWRALSAVADGARAEEARMAAARLFDELRVYRPTEDGGQKTEDG
jgi:tetratricopeptide (TPR) repeat protein